MYSERLKLEIIMTSFISCLVETLHMLCSWLRDDTVGSLSTSALR